MIDDVIFILVFKSSSFHILHFFLPFLLANSYSQDDEFVTAIFFHHLGIELGKDKEME